MKAVLQLGQYGYAEHTIGESGNGYTGIFI